jgi:predicted amidohydrolase YtcJ
LNLLTRLQGFESAKPHVTARENIRENRSISCLTDAQPPSNAKVLDLNGRTAIPGLVGMHNHLFYTMGAGGRDVPMNFSFARLYLAAGVTTIRTAGAVDYQKDWATKDQIEKGEQAGPKVHLTGPYIDRLAGQSMSSSKLSELVSSWAEQGVTSLKVYVNTGRSDLAGIINAAHSRGLTVAGHLCAVGFATQDYECIRQRFRTTDFADISR